MPMTPVKMIKLLKKNGLSVAGQNGSHVKLKNIDTILRTRRYSVWTDFFIRRFFTGQKKGVFGLIPECMTQGDDMRQAYQMAAEALGLSITTMEENKEPIHRHLCRMRLNRRTTAFSSL